MSIAIHTKYIGATNTKGARIKATAPRGGDKWSIYIPFEYGADSETRHANAARALLTKYAPGLLTETLWLCGSTIDQFGYVFSIYPQSTNEKA